MRKLYLLSTLLFVFGGMNAQQMELMSLNPEDAADLVGKGEMIIDLHMWEDKNGTNYFIRTETEKTARNEADEQSQELFAYHYAFDKQTNEPILKRKITDFERNCPFDLSCYHMERSISLSDLDADGYGEISFMYRLACRSDVSPASQKLMMLEDGEKYALRGYSLMMDMGGDYVVGKEFDKAPAGFLDFAKELWEKYQKEG